MTARPAAERSLGPLAAFAALLAVLAAASAAGLLPVTLLPFTGGPLLAGLALVAPIARASGVTPSWIKLGVLSVLLSPIAFLAAWVPLRMSVFAGEDGARGALVVLFALAAIAQLLGRGSKVRLERPGAATAFALVLSAGLALLVGGFGLSGNAPRASYHGLLHAALVLATERATPPTNPWMADAPLAYYWVWHSFAALVAHVLRMAPTEAMAAINVWAIAPMPLVLQLTAAVVWRDARREIAATIVALFGLGSVSGLVWLARGAPSVVEFRDAMDMLAHLALGVPQDGPLAFDTRLNYALSKFGNANSYPASIALLAGAWFAASHALRHGVRPWPWLAAVLHGASAALNPLIGLVGAFPTAAAVVFAPRGARRGVFLVLLALFLAPAAWSTGGASEAYGDSTVVLAPSWRALAGAVVPVALLLPGAAFAFMRGAPGAGWRGGDARVAVVAMLLLAGIGPIVLHALVELPYDNQYKFVRIAALPLGLASGGGVIALIARGGGARAAGLVIAVFLGGGIVANEWRGARAYVALARAELPFTEEPLALAPVPTGPGSAGADIAAAYAFLRGARELRAARPVLVLDAFEQVGYGYGEPQRAFIAPHNLQGHEAPAFAAIDLWFDRPSQVLARSTPGLEHRRVAITQLLRQRDSWNHDVLAELRASERAVVVLIGARDKDRVPKLAQKFEQGGFARLWSHGTAEMFVYPPALAASHAAETDR